MLHFKVTHSKNKTMCSRTGDLDETVNLLNVSKIR